jgi:hypothetical protein
VPKPLCVVSAPSTSSTTIYLESHALGEILELYNVEMEEMEPSISKDANGGGTSSSLPKSAADEAMEISMENLASSQAFVDNQATSGPLTNWVSKELIKFYEETINWLGDPLAVLEGLTPTPSTTDFVALSPREIMDKMSHHFLDVSSSDFSRLFI